MSYAAGVVTKVSVSPFDVQLSSTAASGGTGPYTYQWYRSIVSGFTPGGGNILSGKTALSLDDASVIPGTQYYYVIQATDTGNSNVTANSAQFSQVTPADVPSQSQFTEAPLLGMIDLRLNYDTVPVQVDSSQVAGLAAGQAVKIVASAGGVPKVIACAADSDAVWGFVNYDIKSILFLAGAAMEVSQSGNVIYLRAVEAISRGAQVALEVSTVGGVKNTGGGATVVGLAFDQATAAGDLIRVKVSIP